MRWHIRRIGFQHDRLQRKTSSQTTQLQRALKGQGTTKAEFETQCDEGLRLLLAAVKGMGNTVPTPGLAAHLTQPFEHLINRAPRVRDHRQIMAAGQSELLQVKMLLALAQRAGAQLRYKVVEP